MNIPFGDIIDESNREASRKLLYRLLGDLPNGLNTPVNAIIISIEEHDSYILEKIVLDLNDQEPVPAYYVRPKGMEGPFPTLLFNHSHGGRYDIGKEELLQGNVYLHNPSYAVELTRMGYAVLSIDAWGFGERSGRTESELFKEMLWKGQVLWGKMIYDSLRAVDYLVGRSDTDQYRIGTIGMSMGSTMAWWTAALDTRMKVCLDMCCLTDFHTLIEAGGLDEHGIYYYVPSLLTHFSTAEINALIAPRAHFSFAGTYDALTPVLGLDRIDQALKQVYQQIGKPEAWELFRYPVGHCETAEMRLRILSLLQEWL